MKIRFLLIISTLSILSLKAQMPEFAPIGAKWWYDRGEKTPEDGFAFWRFEVIKDTIIDGLPLKEITRTFVSELSEFSIPFYLHSESGELSIYNLDLHVLEPYFNFNAVEGDTIETTSNWDDVATSIVDSIRNIEIDGVVLKRYYLTSIGEEYYFASDGYCNCFTERLGSDGYFFASYIYFNPPEGARRCYEDDVLGLQGGAIVADCEYYSTEVSDLAISNFIIYPNPVIDKFYIYLPRNDNPNIILKNIAGEEVFFSAQNTSNDLIECDISNMPPGFYFVSVILQSGIIITDAIIKL